MDIGVGISIRSSTLLLVFCCILLCSNAENLKQQQLKSAMVVGTVYCDTCFRQQFSTASHFISGASVAVECIDGTTKTGFRREVKTNRHGVFRVRLPLKISKDVDNIKACSAKLVRSSEPFCAVASSATSAGLHHLKSKRNGLHVFSAGFFTFKPLKRPELCHLEPKPVGSAKSVSFANQKQAQPAMSLPSAPFLPSPGLPLPPVPLVPPPSLLPPIIPSPPGPVIPPITPSPPPSLLPPLPNLPPVPVLTPPPPPPPASIFPPFPIPFPPNPFFPGNPPHPAETSP